MPNRIAFLLVPFLCFSSAFADGERDNNPEVVRRIPKAGVPVPEERANSLRAGLSELQGKIAQVQKVGDANAKALLPDVMIFERAVRVALDYDEFFSPKDIDKADALLVEGSARADQLLAGEPEWPNQSGLIVRGYVSRIDHTVQPYGLVVPKTYAFNHSVPTRCDLWFHGRGETLSEVNFIWDRMKNPGRYTPEHTIMLHPYGRYSNAFKFAGEVDVLEALEDAQKRYRIDEDRISVRGFSMGGAACWQFAVHYPDRWFAANPGAGFSETPQFLDFFQKETLNPTPWEKQLWNLYDCDKYAANLAHCPTIAYSGENDIQKQAADVMEAALKEHGIRLRHIIGAGMGHKIDDVSKRTIEKVMTTLADREHTSFPRNLRFQTHTLKYNRMYWLTVDALDDHWKPASIHLQPRFDESDSSKFDMRCSVDNISAFTVDFPAGTFSDDPEEDPDFPLPVALWLEVGNGKPNERILGEGPFSDGSARLQVHRSDDGKWCAGPPDDSLRKRHNLQGPIDDAFMDSFVFVRPTGKAANEAAGKWAEAELERAIEHWRRHFRGDARVVDDTDVTDELIESANLVLWGDPSSNSVMAKVADKLPVKWTDKQIVVGQKTYDAGHHAPILIYPNPLNQNRYVVFNSSFTFRDYAYLNNARQVPMLPDWAVVDLRTPPGNVWPGKVVAADFFDEQWQLKK
ncbi:prolyl oligopeptidase family serine peptidase [Fuerstiella marisgermanici]|uniref:Prolyl oligopeptidase family protein n=1 Tax=Fuerstiella marisgermanici TaxID=1891926 RepID=A0A1P8WL41_9PLAN|nr:prolyl oligopeptidase family serine peptidase [Fuerstiella marisgermanici]APZ94776.1 Prolyl oligopeptidase family protein [Fuerstiella marisgermanici]